LKSLPYADAGEIISFEFTLKRINFFTGQLISLLLRVPI